VALAVALALLPPGAPAAPPDDAPAASAPALLLAKVLGPGVEVTQYLVSEKFDGVRAHWDGQHLRFRSGAEVHAPSWFLARLPQQALDGELWLGRGRFDALSAIVRKEVPLDDEWRQLSYLIYELPGAPGSFAERAEQIRAVVAGAGGAPLVAVEQLRLGSRAELQRQFDEVVRAGGEGLMLHLAEAPYLTGRSEVLLKLKPIDDAEAVVLQHLPGKGKYSGMLGALRVRTPDGRVFTLGTGYTDALRANPPPIGATVTYTHRGLTSKGLPRFASFLRVQDGL
jgi:DNA ligase-1